MSRARVLGVQVLGLVVVLVTTFLGWARTGQQWRSSYNLFAVARRVGFTHNRLLASALRLWVLLPALIGMAFVLAAFRKWRLSAAIGCLVGAAAGWASAALLASRIDNGPAPAICLAAGILVVVSGSAVLAVPA